MVAHKNLKTWIEIDKKAVKHNVSVFRRLLKPKTKLFSVVKSNAYGHGIHTFPKLADEAGADGFCVDSVVEGMCLREQGIVKPILVLGYTLSGLFKKAYDSDITITISTRESLEELARVEKKPNFHLKIDTGMHRHGIYPADLKNIVRIIKKHSLPMCGICTHFASAKDINYPAYTEKQFKEFKEVSDIFKKAGFKNITEHVAATGGALVNKKYHLDWVRVGIGLYGLWPSKELEIQLGDKLIFKPVLSWKTIIAEIKDVRKGEYVGYDMAYRAPENKKLAVLPVGYWHGYARNFFGTGSVLVCGKEAPLVGRVSMDVIVVDITDIRCKPGDIVTIIGKDGVRELRAADVARKIETIHYELLTRLNPLIGKIIV